MAVLHIFAQANVSDNQQLGQFLLEQAHGLLDDAIGGIGAGSFGIFAIWNTEEQNRGHAKFMSPGRLAQEFVRGKLKHARHRVNGPPQLAPAADKKWQDQLPNMQLRLPHQLSQGG
jgi:hypothetical protein